MKWHPPTLEAFALQLAFVALWAAVASALRGLPPVVRIVVTTVVALSLTVVAMYALAEAVEEDGRADL